MKTSWLLLVVLVLLSGVLLGHGEEKTGILVDAKCGAQIANDTGKVTAHPNSCSLESKEAGYGIVSDGKFFKFDDYGNKQALLLLKVTEKTSNLKVRVGGHFEGDLIKVGEIETID